VKIALLYVGKTRDAHSNAIAEEFVKRSSRYLNVEMREIQPARYDLFGRHAAAHKILLDPAGELWNSAQFTSLVKRCQIEARDLVFLVGGAAGLPPDWRPKADSLLSLSPMTLPHELARAVLAEQIYRAVTTLNGHPYPR
jgi:23S rRNA (pseudouridine1915-N3)-methyltransferase